MLKKGLHTIGFSFRDFDKEEFQSILDASGGKLDSDVFKAFEQGNTLIGLIAMKDDLRDHVEQTVEKVEKGHVNIRIISNNALDTARQIAIESNILKDNFVNEEKESVKRQFAIHAMDFGAKVGAVSYNEEKLVLEN